MPKLESNYAMPRCPRCNEVMDGYHHPLADMAPAPGDFALCAECRCLSRYTDAMQLRPVTVDELEAALHDGEISAEDIVMSGAIVTEVHRRRPKH